MELHSALLTPIARLLGGIITVNSNIISLTLPKAHTLAALQIYRRQYYHNTPFEEGTPFSNGSIFTALRSARAKLLKSPSHT
jgi:hypothetical protein